MQNRGGGDGLVAGNSIPNPVQYSGPCRINPNYDRNEFGKYEFYCIIVRLAFFTMGPNGLLLEVKWVRQCRPWFFFKEVFSITVRQLWRQQPIQCLHRPNIVSSAPQTPLQPQYGVINYNRVDVQPPQPPIPQPPPPQYFANVDYRRGYVPPIEVPNLHPIPPAAVSILLYTVIMIEDIIMGGEDCSTGGYIEN